VRNRFPDKATVLPPGPTGALSTIDLSGLSVVKIRELIGN
jgi:hypothetical protein